MNVMDGNINANWVPGITLEEIERTTILAALRFYRGNVAQTAIALGVSDKTIRNKLEKYEVDGTQRADRDAIYRAEQSRILDRMRGINVNQNPVQNQTANQAASTNSNPGARVESAPKVSPELSVPVSVGKEVQSVLPKSASGGHQGRRR